MGRVIGFFKTPAGAGMLFLVAMFVFFYFVREYRERRAEEQETANKANVLGRMSPEEEGTKPGSSITSEWVKEGQLDKFNPPAEEPAPVPVVVERPPSPQPAGSPPKLVHLYQAPKGKKVVPSPPKPPRTFAPTGTLIPCQLVITVDSSSLETPVVGFVTEDVWHNQERIIPAGTEVHCFAKRGRVRDRIEVTGTWRFVWQDGREVRIHGIALDRDYDPDADSYAITDGSAGIRGSVHKSDEFLEFKLFAATALAGATRSAEKTTRTAFGEYADSSLGNAALEGASEVAERYANLMLDQIEGDGLFVRVPAGTEFYVYTLQTFEPKLASVAALKQGQQPSNSWQKLGTVSHDPALPESVQPPRQQALPPSILRTLEERDQLEHAVQSFLTRYPDPSKN